MADFYQGGAITTLHRLGTSDLSRLERELVAHARSRPIALVLPCLYSELEGKAIHIIVGPLDFYDVGAIDQIAEYFSRF